MQEENRTADRAPLTLDEISKTEKWPADSGEQGRHPAGDPDAGDLAEPAKQTLETMKAEPEGLSLPR